MGLRGPESNYTVDVADEIVRRLSRGEPLAHICRDEHMPGVSTVSRWRKLHPDFNEGFLQARDDGYDAIAERLRKTARGKSEEHGGDSSGDVMRDKLIVETDLKLLAKWDPRRYGDKQQVEHSGSMTLEQMVLASMTPPKKPDPGIEDLV